MTWFHAAGGQQAGPFTDAQFADLVASGTIQPSTLVWQEKLPNWIPLSQVPREMLPPIPATPGNNPAAPPTAAPLRCSNCGGQFTSDNLVQIENALVCPNCKPVVLNRIKEGINPLSKAVTPDEIVYRVDSENRRIDIGRVFSTAWDVYKSNFWPTIGVTVVVFVVMMAGGALPFIGSCVSLVISGPLMGGLYTYYLKSVRGEDASMGDGFSGFTRNFMQLMLAYVVPSLLAYVPLIPFGIYFVARNFEGFESGDIDFGVVDGMLLGVGLIAFLFFVVAWIFVIPLVVDKGVNFWEAMGISRRVVMKRAGSVILLGIAMMGLGFLGVLACIIGLVFVAPLIVGAYIVAYDDLFGDQPVESNLNG